MAVKKTSKKTSKVPAKKAAKKPIKKSAVKPTKKTPFKVKRISEGAKTKASIANGAVTIDVEEPLFNDSEDIDFIDTLAKNFDKTKVTISKDGVVMIEPIIED